MNFRGNVKKAIHTGFYAPVTVYFMVFALVAIVGYNVIGSKSQQATSSYAEIFSLLLKVTVFFTCSILTVAALSVVISFVHFLIYKQRKQVSFGIETAVKHSELVQKQAVQISIAPILKPFLGFVKIRLLYDGEQYSHKFSLLENGRKTLVDTRISGTYYWPLPQIREYQVENAILYFEDVFQFFSFAVKLPAKNNFYTHPTARKVNNLAVLPRKTEDTSTRIDQMRKVEGEYLNYKNFENNDDVRRIVWKIYAKNKDLVVRIPEIMDPYASHLYLYPSFYSQFVFAGNSVLEVPFLNYYKVILWSVYENLAQRGFEVRYIADQDVAVDNTTDEKQAVKHRISTSNWHQSSDLKSFVKTNDASVVVVSSLSNATEVQTILENNSNITFVFVRLSDSLKQQKVADWLQWLFIETAADSIDVYKRNWSLSTMRKSLLENEQKLAMVIARHQEAVEL